MSGENKGTSEERVLSLDALRGFDMFFITGGGAFLLAVFKFFDNPFFQKLSSQFDHTEWHGFHFWDLIFPLFIFIVGASMPYAINKRIERGHSRKKIYIHIIRRSLTLFLLGLIMNGLLDFDFSAFHYCGVLQRISIAYFFAALIVMNTNIRNQAIIAGSLLILYWMLMTLIPVPGYGAGVITPEGSFAAYIDQKFLPGEFYRNMPFDEDGILGQMSSISAALMGVLAGHWLRTPNPQNKKVLGLLAAGIGSVIAGLIWHVAFPITFRLWTSTYTMLTVGLSSILLGVFYWIIDVRGYKKWVFPFVVIGLNPITIYVAQRLFDFGIIANIFIHGFIDYLGPFKPIFWAFCVLIVKWLFLYFLYKKKIFLKA